MLYSYPETEWNGGKVHQIAEDILHLMRGYVFEIDNKKIFAFGGAYSIDKEYRKEGITWFRDELPNQEEYDRGIRELKKHNYKVDYILTHTAPYDIAEELSSVMCDEEEELQLYLQNIADQVTFKAWLFGHFHEDLKIGKYRCLYDRFLRINDREKQRR